MIAILTEGVSEYRNLRLIYSQLRTGCSHGFMAPLKINVSPDAPPPVIARECKPRLRIAARNGAQLAIVLLDRERRSECPGAISSEIEDAISRMCRDVETRVVLKDRMFENWLVADPDALARHPGRYLVTTSLRGKVSPDKADRANALTLLKATILQGHYEKVVDSERILRSIDLRRAAQNSRSLRHFLHSVGFIDYQDSCVRPCPLPRVK